MSTPPRTALMILDVFNTFDFPGGEDLASATVPLIPSLRTLRQRFRAARLPVIYVNDNLGRWSDSFGEIIAYTVSRHVVAAAVAESLTPGADEFTLLKPRHSAFFETPLPSLLGYLDVDHIVVSGIAGDYCVLSTVLDARVRNIRVTVPCDAIASESGGRNDRVLCHLAETCCVPTPPVHAISLP